MPSPVMGSEKGLEPGAAREKYRARGANVLYLVSKGCLLARVVRRC